MQTSSTCSLSKEQILQLLGGPDCPGAHGDGQETDMDFLRSYTGAAAVQSLPSIQQHPGCYSRVSMDQCVPYNPIRDPDLKTAVADTVAFLSLNSHLSFLPTFTLLGTGVDPPLLLLCAVRHTRPGLSELSLLLPTVIG